MYVSYCRFHFLNPFFILAFGAPEGQTCPHIWPSVHNCLHKTKYIRHLDWDEQRPWIFAVNAKLSCIYNQVTELLGP